MEWNYEGFIDTYGLPVFDLEKKSSKELTATEIRTGVIHIGKMKSEGLKDDQDSLNEYYRQFPRTEEHALEMKLKIVYLI